MRKSYLLLFVTYYFLYGHAQLKWTNVDSFYKPLPSSVHIYFTDQPIDTAVFRAYYLVADLRDKKLDFTVDTTLNRRLIPSEFYERDDNPLVVVNCTFFSFETNKNLNAVVRNGKLVSYNVHTIPGRGRDTFTYRHPLGSAIGISKNRRADVAWLLTDSSTKHAYSSQSGMISIKDSVPSMPFLPHRKSVRKWNMQTAVGGGPVVLQGGEIKITNEEELKFAGKAINDKHPRTAMGYTKDYKLVILLIEGRNNMAHGATLQQEAQILKDLGCVEALNLDGGGSSCLLVNGRETIKPSDSTGQRPVPAVFIIQRR